MTPADKVLRKKRKAAADPTRPGACGLCVCPQDAITLVAPTPG